MPRPQKALESHGLRKTKRKRKGRWLDKQHRATRSTEGANWTGILWLFIGVIGCGLVLLGFVAWPLVFIGGLMAVAGFALAVSNFDKARKRP